MRKWWKWTCRFLGNQDGKLEKIFTPNKTIRRIFGIKDEQKKSISGFLQGLTFGTLGGKLLKSGIEKPARLLAPAFGGLVGAVQGATTGLFGKPGAASAGRGFIAGAGPTAAILSGNVLSSGGFGGGGFGGGGAGAGASGQGFGGRLLDFGRQVFGRAGGTAGTGGGGTGGGGIGQGLFQLGASLLRQQPQFQTDFPGRARKILAEQPNLQLATEEIKKLALSSPEEILGPASDEFINASLRQTRQAHQEARQTLVDRAGSQGRTERTSGSLRSRLQEIDQAQIQRETDFITKTQDARRLAAVGIKVQAIAQFFDIANLEALRLLALEGFVTEQDASNFANELQSFQGSQELIAKLGGRLLFPT